MIDMLLWCVCLKRWTIGRLNEAFKHDEFRYQVNTGLILPLYPLEEVSTLQNMAAGSMSM